MSKKKDNKKKTIGALCGSRGIWGAINPVTRVVPDKKKYNRKEKHKNRGDY